MAIVVRSLWIHIPKVDKTVIGCQVLTLTYIKLLKYDPLSMRKVFNKAILQATTGPLRT